MRDTQTLYPRFVHYVALCWRLVLGQEFLGFTLLLRRGGKSSLQRLPENKHYFSKLKSRSNGAALRPTVSPVLTSSAIANLRQYCRPCWESSMYAAFNQREEDDLISTWQPSSLLGKIKSKPPSKASHCLGMLHQVCARLRTVLTIMKKESLDCRERLSLERDQKCHGMVDTSSFRHVCIFLACWPVPT